MRIARLTRDNVGDVYCCLGDRIELFQEEISECTGFVREKLGQGWLAYAVYDDGGKPIGMAIVVPPHDPLSAVAGEGVYYFHCLDINKDKREQGTGSRLLEQAIADVKALGGKGIAVDCYDEYWMSCKFFKSRGFEEVQTFPEHSLLLKRITEDARVEFVEASYSGDLAESEIQVDIQHTVTCPFMLKNFRNAKEILKTLEPEAVVRERMIATEKDVNAWGGSGFYVNGKSVSPGPVDEDRLKKVIEEAKRTGKT